MARLGKISLQATDNSDLFLNEEVYLNGVIENVELQTEISEPGFESDKAYITGAVPKEISVKVDGDTSILYGWFKGENFTAPFRVTIYIIYEEVEALLEEEKK